MSTSTALIPVGRATPDELVHDPSRLLLEWLELRHQAAWWKAHFQRAKQREQQLHEKIRELEAKVKQLEHQLFGKKSEKKNRAEKVGSPQTEEPTRRSRGQQPGNSAPRRRTHQHLPEIEDTRDLPEAQKSCPDCGRPFAEFPGTEDSETIEIEVQAHRRVIRRKRYRATCPCAKTPGVITAPAAAKLIPKGRYGISVWTHVLLDKFLFYRPSQRLIADLATHGIELPPGTLADGLKRIGPMLEPLYQAIGQQCQNGDHWHADETGWKVFVKVQEKPDHKRTLWVYRSSQAVFFAIALTKAAKEAEAFFGTAAEGILSADRASNYKALTAVKQGTLILAFCWAHTRRDFLDAARGDDGQQDWAQRWLERIGQLFHLNKLRVAAWEKDPHGQQFAEHDAVLRANIEDFRKARDQEPKEQKLPLVRQRILNSLVHHWDGLTVFLDHPEVPMDNSEAERQLRGPAMGRKNYWGSGAVWAGQLAERCFSLFATLILAGINVRTWLTAFFTACAQAGGQAPCWATELLPWNLSEQHKTALQQPLLDGRLSEEVRSGLDALAKQAVPSDEEHVVPPAEPPPPLVQGTCRRPPVVVFPLKYCGRCFGEVELHQIRHLIAESADSSRAAISRAVCRLLGWRKSDGGLKEVSCRVALLRMHKDGLLRLPPPCRVSPSFHRRAPARTPAAEPQPSQQFSLAQLGPLHLQIVGPDQSSWWNEYIDRYHYLGYTPLVGAQMRYLVYGGRRLLALLGYGASAWRLAPRDCWIGWNEAQRQAGLPHVLGQARFLILPWIRCPNLASTVLALSSSQLPADWHRRYGIWPWLLESFVDTNRFLGTCYRAANWIDVGQTQGRGKKDRRSPGVPRKQIYLYPLARNCRKRLCQANLHRRD